MSVKNKTVCVVGLGYVGLPLAKAFSKYLKTIGFDIDRAKTQELNENSNANLICSSDPSLIEQADFVIIAVPTPVTKSKEPDLFYVKSAAEISRQESKERSYCSLRIYRVSGRYRRVYCTYFRAGIGAKMWCGF